jgi:hypothetical protein
LALVDAEMQILTSNDLIDHIIIGDGRWLSLRRLGLGFPVGK